MGKRKDLAAEAVDLGGLPERMKAFRRRHGVDTPKGRRDLPQEKCSAMLGCTVGSWANWESGKYSPRGRYAVALSEFLDADERNAEREARRAVHA